MSRPRLTVRAVRGLRSILAVARVELEAGDEGYFGSSQGFDGDPRDIERAIEYLEGLIEKLEGP